MLASYDSDSSRSSGYAVKAEKNASFQQPTVKPADLEVEKRQQRGPGTESPSERFAKRVGMDSKLVIVMVGLPARGKSYVTKKLCRYLTWLQYETRIFNVGERRRTIAGRPLDPTASKQYSKPTNSAATILDEPEHSASFFDPANAEAGRLRERVALDTLDDLLDYLLEEGGSIGLFDATNSTLDRRRLIVERVKERAGPELGVLFLESQCFDEALLEKNISLKLSGPDYIGQDPVAALKDFKKRVAMYEKKYAPIGDYEERNGLSFCQMIDVGRKFVTHKINGFLATQVVNYLQHFNLAPRQVWLTRHGESIDNIAGKIGGDSELSPYGVKFSRALSRFIDHERDRWTRRQQHRPLSDQCPLSDDKALDGPDDLNGLNCTEAKRFWVWTSMMQRSIQTAQFFDQDRYEVNHMRMLDDLNAGMLEGLTHEQVKELYADEYEQRQRDKLRYRYLGERGEGYLDVTNRLKSVILELERVHDHVLLIAPQSVTRILLAYCRGLKSEEITDLHVPLGTLYMLEPVSVLRLPADRQFEDMD
ncbi:6-phosphofructo-2-kinase [Coniosporium apollinis]|uniref:6-phosphofructo-2-kinase n=1 Tax=Coniosporium apollinis TaxID=61459 RepID=A0ABQ9NY73_9PEZI|nr:6-phosphofructo-2-kinase [Coniosporium apollinis]